MKALAKGALQVGFMTAHNLENNGIVKLIAVGGPNSSCSQNNAALVNAPPAHGFNIGFVVGQVGEV